MTHLAALILCMGGFTALSFSASRQQEELFGSELSPSATTAWRGTGAVFLFIALVLLVAGEGWGLGLVEFSGHTSLAAGLVYLSLVAWRRRAGSWRSRREGRRLSSAPSASRRSRSTSTS